MYADSAGLTGQFHLRFHQLLPPKNLTNPYRTKRERKSLTSLREEEIDRLFRVIDSIRDRAIFRLAYHAGPSARARNDHTLLTKSDPAPRPGEPLFAAG